MVGAAAARTCRVPAGSAAIYLWASIPAKYPLSHCHLVALIVCALDCGIYILREGACLAHAALCCRGPRVAARFELREYGPLQVVTVSSLVEQTTPTTIVLVDERPGILLMLEGRCCKHVSAGSTGLNPQPAQHQLFTNPRAKDCFRVFKVPRY